MNSAATRTVSVIIGVAVTTVVAFLAAAECTGSRVYAPGPLSTIVPAIYLQQGLGQMGVKVGLVSLAACVGFVYGIALLGHLVRGRERVSILSVWAVVLLAVADVAFLALSFRLGAQYQGLAYTLSVVALNVVLLLAVAAALRRNRLRPSFASNYTFHAVLVLWLCWFSFPWLGEMP